MLAFPSLLLLDILHYAFSELGKDTAIIPSVSVKAMATSLWEVAILYGFDRQG